MNPINSGATHSHIRGYGIIPTQSKIVNQKSEIVNEEFFFSRNHPQITRLLGVARMPHHPALLHPGGRRDDEPCHLPARVRPRAVERGVRRAVCPPR